MTRFTIFVLVLIVAVAGCDKKPATSEAAPATHVDRPKAPAGFDGATAWLNVTRPLTPQDLEGRVVVVDFWTSCCINCLHTLPVLAALEKKHAGQGLLVVGVHSPKFDAETENERLRAAIAENEIKHPVAVDGAMKVWTTWGAKSWPTIVVLDAHGGVVWRHAGEPDREELAKVVSDTLAEGEREKALKKAPIEGLAVEAPDTGPLAFPGKIVALANGDFAFSDTLHHRVVVTDKTFATKEVIGTGLEGATDGGYAEASFRKPQGIAEAGDLLYVADTENHAIRVIDRAKKTVSTVAGTGQLAGTVLGRAGKARETALRSPWDVAFTGGVLYVALAGSHQIGVYDPKADTFAPFAGNGAEKRVDGKGEDASFAQPSGLTTDGKTLWVADSESSSIRSVSLATKEVKTVVGKDLFVFGDKDGAADAVRLEHPLGLVVMKNALFVVDTYNSKVKRIDLATGSTRTVAGGRDHKDLFEPSGISVAGNDLVVTDTKHHRLARVVVSADGDGKIEPIAVTKLTAPSRGVVIGAVGDAAAGGPPIEKVEIPEVHIRPDAPTKVKVSWKIPAGTQVNDDAPFKVRWNRSDGLAEPPADVKSKGNAVKEGFEIAVKPIPGAPNATLGGVIDMVICDAKTHAVCVPIKRDLELGFTTVKDAPAQAKVDVPLPEAKAQ